jgi:hypothetical protein
VATLEQKNCRCQSEYKKLQKLNKKYIKRKIHLTRKQITNFILCNHKNLLVVTWNNKFITPILKEKSL